MTDEPTKDVNLAHAASEDFRELAKTMGNAPIAPAQGVAALALSMAIKYHDMCVVKDGVLYQQYKLESRNIELINLDSILQTAERIEMWMLGASDRIAKLVVEAIEFSVEDAPGPETGGNDVP